MGNLKYSLMYNIIEVLALFLVADDVFFFRNINFHVSLHVHERIILYD